MIFDRITILRSLFPGRVVAGQAAARWTAAADADADLVGDVIRLGGVLATTPAVYVGGVETLDPIDPIRLARDAGRRDFAIELLGLMGVTPQELSDLTREP